MRRGCFRDNRCRTQTHQRFELGAVGDFGLDMDELEAAFNEKTRVLILNTPHNPTGKVRLHV